MPCLHVVLVQILPLNLSACQSHTRVGTAQDEISQTPWNSHKT